MQYITTSQGSYAWFCCVLLWLGFTHVLQGYFIGSEVTLGVSGGCEEMHNESARLSLPQCQWSNPEEYGKTYHTGPQEYHMITTVPVK